MIVITGAGGFIGSCLAAELLRAGHRDLVFVDNFFAPHADKNLEGKVCRERIDVFAFPEWLERNGAQVSFIFHFGANANTAEFDKSIFEKMNVSYTKRLFELATRFEIPLMYASSAATYGAGEHGYSDDHSLIPKLRPLNPYGQSKQDIDVWVLAQKETPPFFVGLKPFNVYGPNEYHKGRMASVVLHSFNQIREAGKVKLFRSYRPDCPDGGQKRDFIYVKDLTRVCRFFMDERPPSGIYNVGTGAARTFLDLAHAVFAALGKRPSIEFTNIPTDIRERYQYFTEAKIEKLRAADYTVAFTTLEDGIREYVAEYLVRGTYY
ncbi:MAG: ADP-glyceromanno-heptose 6-epimerase [Parcubacteria group bacterium Gr01-1014_72]|nr:MAG: ADP-glyceromanno-heptose 6-epimerase [Parcubacteria group bacterium Gr01-1014_72]